MFKKTLFGLLTMLFVLALVQPNSIKASSPIPPGAPSGISPLDLTGDRPPTTSYRWTGYGGVVVGATPLIGANNPAGSISISGIPSGAMTVQAYFYATTWQSNGAATATFQSNALNSVMPISTDDGGGLNLGTYRWDVTSYVNGNGSYSFATTNIPTSYGVMLVIVYQQDDQPIRQVIINEGSESMQNTSSTSVWTNVTAGDGRLILMTEADDASGDTESVTFNGSPLESGDIFHANLGPYATLLTYDVSALNGQNSVTLTTQSDWFGWHLAILESTYELIFLPIIGR